MNKNTFVVSLIDLKEKMFDFYENWEKFLRPLCKGLLAFAVLLGLFIPVAAAAAEAPFTDVSPED